jgi:hypothetical protein
MNKNERRKRVAAAKGIKAFNVHPQYDKTLNTLRQPTTQTFIERDIATKHRPRHSHKPKVGASASAIMARIGR